MARRRPNKTVPVRRNYAEFFKVYLPQLSSHQLLLPPAFVKNFKRLIKEKVILKDVEGRVWHVDVNETPNGVYLKNGWQNFINYHGLKVGEFLVFRYDGAYSFVVKVFGTNGCKKEAISVCVETEEEMEENNTSNKCPRQLKEYDHSLRTKKKSVHSKRFRAAKSELLQEQDVSPETHVESQHVFQEQDVSPENYLESQNVFQEQDVYLENHEESQNVSQEQDVSPENHEESQNVSQEQDVSPKNHGESQNVVSELSCFISPPNSLGKYILRIPDEMIERHKVNLEGEMILRNENGKEWPVKISKISGHPFLGKGLNAFQIDNNVGVDDRCKFTFRKQRFIDVQIIRRSSLHLFDTV